MKIIQKQAPEVFYKEICSQKFRKIQRKTFLKKRLWHRCFSVNFAKFLRTTFLTEHLRWLLLRCKQKLNRQKSSICLCVRKSLERVFITAKQSYELYNTNTKKQAIFLQVARTQFSRIQQQSAVGINSQENSCTGVSLELMCKLKTCSLMLKMTLAGALSTNFVKFFRTVFFLEHP